MWLMMALVGATAGASTAAAQGGGGPELEAPAQEAIAVKGVKGKDEAPAYVTVVNQGSTAASISAGFQASSSTSVKASLASTPTTIPAGEATRVKLVFTGLKELEEPASGQIVIKGGGRTVVQAATVTPALQPAAEWPVVIVAVALGLGVIMCLVIVGDVTLRRDGSPPRLAQQRVGVGAEVAGAGQGASLGGRKEEPKCRHFKRLCWLKGPAPPPKWGLESWATHLTAVGGILGTVLGTASLPETPTQIDKSSVTALSLAFAGLVVVAPFVFEAIQRSVVKVKTEQEEEQLGFIGVLVLTCAITFGAVVGELFTLGLVTWELTGGEGWVWLIEASLGVLLVLGAYYAYVSTRRMAAKCLNVQAQPADQPAYAAVATIAGPPPLATRPAVVPNRASWSLL
jgi:hypothetical protein